MAARSINKLRFSGNRQSRIPASLRACLLALKSACRLSGSAVRSQLGRTCFINKLSEGEGPHGSALLIALVLMGVLLTLSLGVSQIVIGLLKDNRMLLEKTQAWYAAESGVERALFDIQNNPPGFEVNRTQEELSERVAYGYNLKAVASTIPVREQFEIVYPEDAFDELRLNKSVTIPLFRGLAPEDQVKRFKVEYYLPPTFQLKPGIALKDVDILRWKIFGRATSGTKAGTIEAVNQFVPSDRGNAPQAPTCLGTEAASGCYALAPYYQWVLGSDGAEEITIAPEYPVEQFLKDHTENFLVLSNFVNIDLIAGNLLPEEKMQLANIRYRVLQIDDSDRPKLTLPSVKIRADGTSGTTKQSIDLEFERETFLPVFNFALYRTKD